VWLGFMSKTPRWRLSGEALSYTFGAGFGGCSVGSGSWLWAMRSGGLWMAIGDALSHHHHQSKQHNPCQREH
jgi:hypothetical protein